MSMSSTINMGGPARWVTATALKELGLHVHRTGAVVKATELAEWTSSTLTHEQRVHASSRLCALRFLQHSVVIIDGQRHDVYTVTAEGLAAMQAAVAGHVRKSGPKGSRAPNPTNPEALATRLWHLVRLRKVIEVDTAAETLCDAGDDDYARVRSTVARTLRRWELAGALTAGAKRVRRAGDSATSNGAKRYALVRDSVEPPRWRPIVKAAAQGAGA